MQKKARFPKENVHRGFFPLFLVTWRLRCLWVYRSSLFLVNFKNKFYALYANNFKNSIGFCKYFTGLKANDDDFAQKWNNTEHLKLMCVQWADSQRVNREKILSMKQYRERKAREHPAVCLDWMHNAYDDHSNKNVICIFVVRSVLYAPTILRLHNNSLNEFATTTSNTLCTSSSQQSYYLLSIFLSQ